ncbi:hypothetical protein BDV93DRAFT_230769 [Ceratobasidium sp. AG-I]|nr:hypothetical protein BDV93DRAFT_230769 [Ceratobasidium sp. AG-I]
MRSSYHTVSRAVPTLSLTHLGRLQSHYFARTRLLSSVWIHSYTPLLIVLTVVLILILILFVRWFVRVKILLRQALARHPRRRKSCGSPSPAQSSL